MEGYRLSPQQKRAWLVRQADRSGVHPAQALAEIDGHPDPERLRLAVDSVCLRHEALRTVLHRPPGMDLPVQVIRPTPRVAYAVHDGTDAGGLARARAGTVFDLAGDPLVLADLVLLPGSRAALLLTMPGVPADAMSLHVLLTEIRERYDGRPPRDEPLQYADAAEWQHDVLTAPETSGGREFWRTHLAALPPAEALPVERTGAPGGFRPATVPVDLAPDVTALVLQCAEERNWPVDAVFAAAWQALLTRVAGGVVRIATAAANRPHAEMRDAVGPYAQWLPHATAVAATQTFAESVAAVAGQARDLVANQEFFDASAFEEVPVARAAFAWTRRPAQPGWPVTSAVAHREPFPILLDGTLGGSVLRLSLHYDTARLTTDDAGRLAAMYRCLLAAAVADPESLVGSLPMSPDEESRRASADGLPASPVEAPDRCVHTLFEEQAALRPDQAAVVAGDDRLTYRELDERANRIAHRLRRAGVRPEDRVGLVAGRGIGSVAGLLGVLKSGAAYVPVDADLPVARRRSLFEQAGVRHVLTEDGEDTTAFGQAGPRPADEDATGPDGGARLANLAYVVFTSGSTGEPKGVAVTHDSLARYTRGIADVLDLPAGAGYGIVSTFAADLGHTVVYPSLCTGGTLHVLSREAANSPAMLAGYLDRNPVDCLKIVPSHLRALLDGDRPAAVLPKRRLVLGGEALPADLVRAVRELAPDCRLLNHYGPTETTVGVLSHEVTAADGLVPLGRPLPHARVHVLDDRLAFAPLWTSGELCVGGPAVARGYLGKPGATAERFVPDPHARQPGERLYRTGDLARRLGDGTLVFLGRNDEQVKLRGYRVEPAEVAAVLRRHPGVQDATVVVRDGNGAPQLVGYVVADAAPDVLRAHCTAHLPSYLVPSALVSLEAIPLTANGKLDRAALPAPAGATAYAPPQSPVEETLAAIWAELLRVDRVGRHDSFFALGGDSILGIQVVSRANQAGIAVTPPLLFQHPTIAALAAASATEAAPVEAEQGPVTGPVPATPIHRWFLGLGLPDPSHYNQTICLRPRQTLRAEPLRTALDALVAHHDALRLRLTLGADGWTVDNAPAAGHDLLSIADDLEPAVVRAQQDIDIASGCLLHGVLAGGGDAQRLVLVAHHLGVDGVSWRILLEDLATAYRQAAAGQPVRLPAKTTSYRQWAMRMAERAHAHDGEIPYWTDLLTAARTTRIPRDEYRAAGAATYGDSRAVTVELDAAATEALLGRSVRASVHAAVLGALGRVLGKWTGQQQVVVDVEGHGRDVRWPDVDLSRTVGWFTTMHPVRLSADGTAPAPSDGTGYGVLRHLRSDTATARLRALPSPAIRVNYLGRGTGAADGDGLLELVPDRLGTTADPAGRRPYLLDITAVELGGRLRMTWVYSPAVHRAPTIEALAGDCLTELAAGTGTNARAEPEDSFAESGLTEEDLAELMDELETLPAEGDA
ncbi:amino acid adenylation domain-containing protein [Amycolatopsis sp. lyj-23]|uniref:amino acid adenylation domain-containing protein n=1 Tax=Amycolatopsis sp. lyj-23 TaxID=2789283 RepID=UPI0039786767